MIDLRKRIQKVGSNEKITQAIKGMLTFVIERELPNLEKLTEEELKGAAQTSNSVLKGINGMYWMHSYFIGNKIYCVYKVRNAELIQEHTQKLGIPANSIHRLFTMTDLATAN